MELVQIIEAGLVLVFIVVGGLAMGWFKILKETNTLLREQNVELKADNKQWEAKHSENEKAIANLQGQLDTIKNVPLQAIAMHMKQQTEVNEQILKFMKNKEQAK